MVVSNGGVVIIVNRPQAGRSRNCGVICGRAKGSPNLPFNE
jgi:hypothetical protein